MACRLAEPTSATEMMWGKQAPDWNSAAAVEAQLAENRTTNCVYVPGDQCFTLACPQIRPLFTYEHIVEYCPITAAKDKNYSFLSEKCNKFKKNKGRKVDKIKRRRGGDALLQDITAGDHACSQRSRSSMNDGDIFQRSDWSCGRPLIYLLSGTQPPLQQVVFEVIQLCFIVNLTLCLLW